MKKSVLIPSYRRPEMLARCLEGLRRQAVRPDEIIVSLREDDHASRHLVQMEQDLPVKVALAHVAGVIAAMEAGLQISAGEIVALLDDDAIPHHDWLERIGSHFEASPDLTGVGGVDLQINPDHRAKSNRPPRVGIFTWYGGLLGSHHLGFGASQRVHVLKGCNCAYRGKWLRRIGFDRQLRGAGAQVGWEITLGLEAMREGGRLIYDPAIRVDHLIAPRHDGDTVHRGRFQDEAAYDIGWNYFSILRRKAPQALRLRAIAWALLAGSQMVPGVLRLADWRIGPPSERLCRVRNMWRAYRASASGNFDLAGEDSPAVSPFTRGRKQNANI